MVYQRVQLYQSKWQGKRQKRKGPSWRYYRWVWHGWPEHTQDGAITSVIENQEIGLTFGDAGNVIIKFIAKNEDTELQLTQSNIPITEFAKYHYYYGCTMGWSFWMVNLKAYLEHGIVLDERSGKYSGEMEIVNQ